MRVLRVGCVRVCVRECVPLNCSTRSPAHCTPLTPLHSPAPLTRSLTALHSLTPLTHCAHPHAPWKSHHTVDASSTFIRITRKPTRARSRAHTHPSEEGRHARAHTPAHGGGGSARTHAHTHPWRTAYCAARRLTRRGPRRRGSRCRRPPSFRPSAPRLPAPTDDVITIDDKKNHGIVQ